MPTLNPIVTKLMGEKRVEDLYILARYTYANGFPLMNDAQYESIQRYIKNNGLAQEYLDRTYDDDPVPFELLQEFGYEVYIPVNSALRNEYYQILNAEKSTSIDSVTTYLAAWSKFQSVKGHDLVMSLKVDGVYTKKAYVKGEFVAGLSRGRASDSWDYTDALAKIVPRKLTGEGIADVVRLNSECFMIPSSLPYLRAKYDPDKYKTEKSSAISFLRVPRDAEDYQYLRILTFSAEGLGNSISESLDHADRLGFTTVPRIKISPAEVPATFDDFVPWLRNLLDRMNEMAIASIAGTASDGVVVEVDSYTYVPEVKGQYSPRNFALKMEHWAFDTYPAIVKEIIDDDQGRVWRSCRLRIEPMITKDGTEARIINGFNPSILQANGIYPGQRIYFERNSGAINTLIHGGRLKEIERGLSDMS